MPRLLECPAITALNGVLNVFPNLRRDTLVDVRPATRHTSGLAIDIYFNATVPQEKQRATELIDILVKHHKAMLWSDIIFTNFHIGGGIGGYVGDGHTKLNWTGGGHDNHIHLDWVDFSLRTGPEGSEAFINNPYEHSVISKNTSWRDLLEADFQVLASSWESGQPTGPATPQWLAGWWKVWDGNYYYYFFGPSGVVQSTKIKPTNINSPPTHADNTGTYTYTPNRLILNWNQVPGAEAACQETFYDAVPGCRQMNATSNLYSPLVAVRDLD